MRMGRLEQQRRLDAMETAFSIEPSRAENDRSLQLAVADFNARKMRDFAEAAVASRQKPEPAATMIAPTFCWGCNQKDIPIKGYCAACEPHPAQRSDIANALRAGVVTLALMAGGLFLFAVIFYIVRAL